MAKTPTTEEMKQALAKFLDPSKEKRRMYHGTGKSFNTFAPNTRGVHFVTPDPKFADKYAGGEYSVEVGESPNIMPVHVSVSNPFDFENKKHVNDLATKASLGKAAIDQIKKGHWPRIEDRTTLQAIKDMGHDAVYVKENGVKNLGVFHPNQIKSATGNRGTYDTNEHDITKATGGSIHMSNGGKPTIESAVKLGDKDLPITMNVWDKRAGNKIAHVNPEAFDKAFKKSKWQYIGPQGEGGIKDRYQKFAEYAKNAKSADASNVAVDKKGVVTFGDGRHRYAYMRDQGVEKIPMSMDKQSIEHARQHGYLHEDEEKEATKPKKMNKGGQPSLAEMKLALNQHGMYSPLEKAAMAVPRTESMRQQIIKEGQPMYKDGGIIHKAEGGNVTTPSMAQMKMALQNKGNSIDTKNIGVNEAPNMAPKRFFPPDTSDIGMPAPGGVATPSGMPIGGVDVNQQQPGQQLMQTPQGQPPQGTPQNPGAPAGAPAGPTPPMGNMLQMTTQGQTMAALGGGQPPVPPPQGLAEGGQPEKVYTHRVIDPKNNNAVMGKYTSLKSAIKACDRLDNQYGAYRYKHEAIPETPALAKGGKIKKGVVVHKGTDTMRYEMTMKKKG